MGEERKRRAVLSKRQLDTLLLGVLQAKGTSRQVEKRIDAAEMKLMLILGATVDFDSAVIYDRSNMDDKIECEFTDFEVFGLKTALAQRVLPTLKKERESHGTIKYVLRPIARELGIESLFLKEISFEELESEKLTISYDDDPKESEKEPKK